MVTENAIKRNSVFLRSISQTSGSHKLKTLLQTSANSGLKLLVLLVKDFIYRKIPLELSNEEKKKILKYKNQFRALASMGSKKPR